MVSDKILAKLVVIVIIISAISVVTTLFDIDRLGSMMNVIMTVMGYDYTTTTTVCSAGITVTDDSIDFGSGYVWANATSAILDSSNSGVTNGSWKGVEDRITIENTGTCVMKVTVAMDSADAEAFLCGTGDCPNTATAKVEVEIDMVVGVACTSGLQNTYTTLADANGKNTVTLCGEMSYGSGNDQMLMSMRLTIPYDARTGSKSETLTFTGTAV